MKKIEFKIQPSMKSRLELLESGKDKVEKISWRCYDRPNCRCEPIIDTMAKTKNLKHVRCPMADDKGMKKYNIICKNCGELLAYFHAKEPSLDKYCNLHTVAWYDKHSWHGCLGMNRNPHTLVINLECCCGSKVIKEPNEVQIMGLTGMQTIQNIPRYAEYKIIRAKDDIWKKLV